MISWILLAISLILLVVLLIFSFNFKKIRSLFKKGNIIVTGLRGTGKDMLFANVIARDKKPYISNINYRVRSAYIPLNLKKLDLPLKYDSFITGDFIPYDYPYPEKSDIYISDAGVYFPSQHQGQLVRDYVGVPYFQALSRHLGDSNFHCNVQNLNRLWDKIREQSDIYIRCLSCKVIGKLVIQSVIIYDKYDSCLNRVEPYVHIKTPLLGNSQSRAEFRSKDELAYREFKERNGSVKKYSFAYFNKSKYDTRLFKSLLGGDFNEKK